MKKITAMLEVLTLLLVTLVVLPGCASGGIEGTYVAANSTITFKKDGTCEIVYFQESRLSSNRDEAEYIVDGDMVILCDPSTGKQGSSYKLEGDKLLGIGEDGGLSGYNYQKR